MFRFAVPTRFTPNWLNTLADNLPGTKISTENIERIKQRHSSQEQTFQLLKLWKQQNKEQDMVRNLIGILKIAWDRIPPGGMLCSEEAPQGLAEIY